MAVEVATQPPVELDACLYARSEIPKHVHGRPQAVLVFAAPDRVIGIQTGLAE